MKMTKQQNVGGGLRLEKRNWFCNSECLKSVGHFINIRDIRILNMDLYPAPPMTRVAIKCYQTTSERRSLEK